MMVERRECANKRCKRSLFLLMLNLRNQLTT